MIFYYSEFTAGGAPDLWQQIINQLNGLNTIQDECVKVATSDQHDGSARAVVIQCNADTQRPPGVDQLSHQWESHTFETGGNYSQMYQDCTDFINNHLPAASAFTARISMTNAHDNSSFLTVYWRHMDE